MDKKTFERFTTLPDYIRSLPCHEFNANKDKLASVVESLLEEIETILNDNSNKNKELERLKEDFLVLNNKFQNL